MFNYMKISLVVATIALTVTGCANKANVQKDQEIQKLTKELSEANTKAAQLDVANAKVAQLDAANAKIELLESSMIENKTENAVLKELSSSLVPSNAKAGECYARVLVPAISEDENIKVLIKEAQTEIKVIPATYKVEEKKVTIRDESIKLVTIPATYKTVTETIMVEPEKKALKVIPATYKTVTEMIMVEPEKKTLKVIPATYKTVTEKVLVSQQTKELTTIPATYKIGSEKVLVAPAYTTWKHGKGEIEKINDSTGEIMCLVEVPAVYKTVKKKVLDVDTHTEEVITPAVYKTISKKVVDTEAITEDVITPAVYKTISKKVIDTEATTEDVITPAVYKTVSKQEIVTLARTKEVVIPGICKIVKSKVIDSPASEKKIEIPAVYDTYTKTTKTSDSYLKWQQILCETNTNADVVSNIQKALKDKNYNITMIDGTYGAETNKAVQAYQKDNKLAQGALTLETLQSLGL